MGTWKRESQQASMKRKGETTEKFKEWKGKRDKQYREEIKTYKENNLNSILKSNASKTSNPGTRKSS